MYNFERRVVIHDGKEVPSDSRYCLLKTEGGTMTIAFFDNQWVFGEDYYTNNEIKAWCYIEDLFEAPNSADIRMYIDENEKCI